MTVDDLKEYYKTGYNFNKQTGITASQYGLWMKYGYIPKTSQCRIEVASGGALKADITCDQEIKDKIKRIEKKITQLNARKKCLTDSLKGED